MNDNLMEARIRIRLEELRALRQRKATEIEIVDAVIAEHEMLLGIERPNPPEGHEQPAV